MNKAYKFKLKPTKEQIFFFHKNFGCCRFYWNKNIGNLLEAFEKDKFEYKIIYPAQLKTEYEFLKEVDSLGLCNEQIRLQKALKDFLNKKSGKPKFHSKNRDLDSYTTNNIHNSIFIEGKKIKLPKVGFVRIVCHRKLEGKIKNVTISLESNGKYYASICTELESQPVEKVKPKTVIGFDYSSPLTWVDSNGDSPDCSFYRNNLEKIQKNDKKLSRKVKGSNNWKKQLVKNNKLHFHIKCCRKDLLHKVSKFYVDNYDVLVFEDLNLQGIAKALHLGKATHDNGFGMFRTFVEYKAENQGKYFMKVDKNYTTQTCSCCGNVKSKEERLQLGDKIYECTICGAIINRDTNAAINIAKRGWDSLLSLLKNGSVDLCSQEALTFR